LSLDENVDIGTYRMIKYNCITIGYFTLLPRARMYIYIYIYYLIDENYNRVDVFS